jgi:hypothetical protein
MKVSKLFLSLSAFALLVLATSAAQAGYPRQYYSSWNYYPQRQYYYTTYYYKPTPTYQTYSYHYCVHYPSQPRYVYYYNPHRGYYWGRCDLQGKPGEQYSILAEEDRKANLTDIPESAFPKPAAMPAVPEAKDGTANTDNTAVDPPPAPPAQAPGEAAPVPAAPQAAPPAAPPAP